MDELVTFCGRRRQDRQRSGCGNAFGVPAITVRTRISSGVVRRWAWPTEVARFKIEHLRGWATLIDKSEGRAVKRLIFHGPAAVPCEKAPRLRAAASRRCDRRMAPGSTDPRWR